MPERPLVFFLVLSLLWGNFLPKETYKITVFNSLERIRDERPFWERQDRKIILKGAKNEYESFQFGILAEEDFQIKVVYSDLRQGNSIIRKENFKTYQEYFIRVTQSSQRMGRSIPETTGYFPDPLIPFSEERRCARGINLFWVDLYIPEDADEGQYEGEVKLSLLSSSGDRKDFSLPIELEVLPFTLPKRPSLKTLFVFNHTDVISAHPKVNPYLICRRYYEELLRNRILPSPMPIDIRPLCIGDSVYRADFNLSFPTGTMEENINFYLKEKGMNVLEIPVWASASNNFYPYRGYLRDISNYFSNLRDKPLLIDYSFDEPKKTEYGRIQEWARILHSSGDIKHLCTFDEFDARSDWPGFPDERLLDDGTGRPTIDIWVPKIKNHFENLPFYQERQRLGEEVWVYQTGVTDPYSPKWLIDYPLLGFRIIPWLASLYSLKGILYWGVVSWQRDVWEDPRVFVDGHIYNGEGYLLYPGSKISLDEPIPSLRLKWLRDGIEDYEYINILSSINPEIAREKVRGIGRNWADWEGDKGILIKVREEIVMAIKDLNPIPNPNQGNISSIETQFHPKKAGDCHPSDQKFFDAYGRFINRSSPFASGVYFSLVRSGAGYKVKKIIRF